MIDFHCHLDLYPEPTSVIERCTELAMYVLSVTTTPSAWEQTAKLAAGSPRIRTALGLHPQLARQRKHELVLFRTLLEKTRYVGEVGLDGTPDCKVFWDDQLDVFHDVLECCSRLGGKILSLHSRRAASEVLRCLRGYPAAGQPVLHWFSGSRKELKEALDIDCWFSVGPAMFNSARGRELISMMPLNRVLTESDGPFARNEDDPLYPWDVSSASERLAQIWERPQPEVSDLLRQNLESLTELSDGRDGIPAR